MKVIYSDGRVDVCAPEEELSVMRHTGAHILAQAIKHLYPQAHFAYGPATDNGFYYDVDLGDAKLSDEDLQAIEQEMGKIVKANLPIKPFTLPRDEAIALMEERGEKYKVEHIGDLPEDAVISFYQQGDYIDMCVGPHLCYTKGLKAFKITSQSGAPTRPDQFTLRVRPPRLAISSRNVLTTRPSGVISTLQHIKPRRWQNKMTCFTIPRLRLFQRDVHAIASLIPSAPICILNNPLKVH